MDWQYYPHRHITDLEREFEYKKNALYKLKSMGLDCPYISSTKTYDQLYVDEVQKDFNCNEAEYLKEGIIHIFECLMVIKNEVPVTEDGALKLLWKERSNLFARNRELQGFGDEEENTMISNILDGINRTEAKTFSNSTTALSRELAEFKMRLGRIGINATIVNDEIEFLEESLPLTEFEMINSTAKPKLPNPHSDIFTDGDAFALFEHLHSVFYDKDSKEIYADFSMIYRRMHLDGLILNGVTPTYYIKWIQKNYDISLGSSLKKSENPLKIRFYEILKILR